MPEKTPDIFSLKKIAPSEKKLLNFFGAPLDKLLALDKCGALYVQIACDQSPYDFLDTFLSEYMHINSDFSAEEQSKIPSRGACVVVANHPYGGIEGLILARELMKVRPDVKVMANGLLAKIPELEPLFIPVNPFGTETARKENLKPLKEALNWLKNDGMLLVFPAGEVSHLKLATREIADSEWNTTVARLITKTRAHVLPVYVKGSNSILFHLMGLVHPYLRTIMLPRELLNKRDHKINFNIGSVILPGRLEKFNSDREIMDYLRWRTYLLGYAMSRKANRHYQNRQNFFQEQQPIARPQPKDAMLAEIHALPPESMLVEAKNRAVFYAAAIQIPHILLEMGRLREIAFRQAGEGSGNALDIDKFDAHYHHIFIWDFETNDIIGSYRLGPTDTILPKYSDKGLYSSTLFKSESRFYEILGSALELGRSFVAIDYQRSYTPLLQLWQGIGAYVVKFPQYRFLFGPVSISRDYNDFSRNLVLGVLMQQHPAEDDLTDLIRPKKPQKIKSFKVKGFKKFPNKFVELDMKDVGAVIQDIELTQKDVPVLLRQYLNLGGQILNFNLDKKFSDVLDGLLLIDLLKTDPRILKRYMGKEGAASFYAYHGVKEEDFDRDEEKD